MTTAETIEPRAEEQPRQEPSRGGWRVVAAKELADHLYSGRFIVLLGLLGIATAAAVFAASGGIREVAPNAEGITALFLKLFTVTTDPVPFPLIIFVSLLAPLLGMVVFETIRTFAFQYLPYTWQMAVGIAMLAVILFLPSGLWSLFKQTRYLGGRA